MRLKDKSNVISQRIENNSSKKEAVILCIENYSRIKN